MTRTECPNCQKLQRELKRLQVQLQEALNRIEKLEQELRRGHRQATPFSKGAIKAKPKRSGRRAGQGEFSHRQKRKLMKLTVYHWSFVQTAGAK